MSKDQPEDDKKSWDINKIFTILNHILQFYYVSIPLLIALIVLVSIKSFQQIPGLESPLFDPGLEIGLYFVIMGSIVGLALLYNSKLEMKKMRDDIEQIKNDLYEKKIKTSEPVINKPFEVSRVKWGLLIVSIILLTIGLHLYYNSTENDRSATQTWQGINFFKTKSLLHSDVDLNFIIKDDESLIHIYYVTDNIQNGSFIAIQLPYEGRLTDDNNYWQTIPMPNKSTLIYKKFLCDENNPLCNYHNYTSYDGERGNDQFNLLFKINELIDSKQFYTHSLDIPLDGAINDEVMGFVQFDISDEGVWSWQNSWEDVDARLSVSIQDDATEINTIPTAQPRSHSFELTEVTRTIYSWDIPDIQTTFHIDYVMPNERDHYENYRTWGIVFISNGISILGVFLGTASWRKFFRNKPN